MKVKRTRFKHHLMSPYKSSRSIVSLQQIGNTQGDKIKNRPWSTPQSPNINFTPGEISKIGAI